MVEEAQESKLPGHETDSTVEVNKCPRCCEDDFCNDSCRQNLTLSTEGIRILFYINPPFYMLTSLQ